jgi:hypothetical protein
VGRKCLRPGEGAGAVCCTHAHAPPTPLGSPVYRRFSDELGVPAEGATESCCHLPLQVTVEGPRAVSTVAKFVHDTDPTLLAEYAVLASLPALVRARWVTLRARWVTLRARWVTLRARWVALRARWVTLRARWVTLRARWVTLRARWVALRARWVTLSARWVR